MAGASQADENVHYHHSSYGHRRGAHALGPASAAPVSDVPRHRHGGIPPW
jgi:hypothetical protein